MSLFTISGGGGLVAAWSRREQILVFGVAGLGGVTMICWRRASSFAASSTCLIISSAFLAGHHMSATFAIGLVCNRPARMRRMRAQATIPGLTLEVLVMSLMTVWLSVINHKIEVREGAEALASATANSRAVSSAWYWVLSSPSLTLISSMVGSG